MKPSRIVVSAGRTFNHPHEQYSNFRAHAEIEYELEPGEDEFGAVKTAQARVEGLVEDHKANLLKSVEELENLRVAQREIQGLTSTIAETQRRLDAIRAAHPQAAGAAQIGDATPKSGDEMFF